MQIALTRLNEGEQQGGKKFKPMTQSRNQLKGTNSLNTAYHLGIGLPLGDTDFRPNNL